MQRRFDVVSLIPINSTFLQFLCRLFLAANIIDFTCCCLLASTHNAHTHSHTQLCCCCFFLDFASISHIDFLRNETLGGSWLIYNAYIFYITHGLPLFTAIAQFSRLSRTYSLLLLRLCGWKKRFFSLFSPAPTHCSSLFALHSPHRSLSFVALSIYRNWSFSTWTPLQLHWRKNRWKCQHRWNKCTAAAVGGVEKREKPRLHFHCQHHRVAFSPWLSRFA